MVQGEWLFHRCNVFLASRHLPTCGHFPKRGHTSEKGDSSELQRPFSVQPNFSQPEQNSTGGNTRWRYPQPQELLTLVTGTTRLRVVGTARPATVEARTANPVEQP
jgi:hypothetical protein